MGKPRTLSQYFVKNLIAFLLAIVVLIVLFNFTTIRLFNNFVQKNVVLTISDHLLKTAGLMMLSLTDLQNVANKNLENVLNSMYQQFKSNPNLSDDEIETLLNQLLQTNESIHWYLINKDGIIERTNYPNDIGLDLKKNKIYWEKLSSLQPGQKQFDPVTFETRTNLPRSFSYVKLDDGRIFEIGIFIGTKQIERFLNSIKELSKASETLVEASFFTENLAPISAIFKLTSEDRQNFEKLTSSNLLFVNGPSELLYVYGIVQPKDCPFAFKTKITLNLQPLWKVRNTFLTTLNLILAGIVGFFIVFNSVSARRIRKSVNSLLRQTYEGNQEQLINTNIVEIDQLTQRYHELVLTLKEDSLKMTQQAQILLEQIRRQNELQAQLAELASTDDMTKTLNRRAAFEIVRKLIESKQSTISLCYFDVDHLKFVNDTFGHDVGDILLKYVVEKVRKHLRKTDYVARLGGDEFLIILPDVSKKETETIMQRVQKTFNDVEKPEQLSKVEVSISYGIIEVKPTEDLTVPTILKELDKLMYEHKKRQVNNSRNS